MEALELALLLLAAVLVSAVIDQVVPKVSSPLIQILLGVVIVLAAGKQVDIELDPELFLVLFIAPLLYDEARHVDKAALWKNIKPVLSVAIGLVIATALIVGFVLDWIIPSIPLAGAFALGAALGPTDAVAVTTLSKGDGIGQRQRCILRGECLINDASGIVSFQFAIAACVTGTFSLIDASIDFAISFFGGIALGVLLGFAARWIVSGVRSLGLENTTFHVSFDILTPFIVFLVAEAVQVSGIIVVVCAGLVVSTSRHAGGPAASRLNIVSTSVWRVISFVLNGLVFVLLGTQLPKVMSSSWEDVSISNVDLIGYVVLLTVLIVAIRFVWMICVEAVHRFFARRSNPDSPGFGKADVLSALVMTLGGPKGTITLSIMLTIPVIMSNGVRFPQRDLLIFLACGVIVCTLLLSTFVVPLLAPKRDIKEEEREANERELAASVDILRSVIEELAGRQTPETRRATQSVIHQYNDRIARIKEHSDLDEGDNIDLRIMALRWERGFVEGLIDRQEVHPTIGYEYLERLARIEGLLKHRGMNGSLRIKFLQLVSKLESFRHNLVDGVPFLNESDRMAAFREVQLRSGQMVIERLRQNISDIDAPAEDVGALLLEYTRSCAALRSGRVSITSMAKAANRANDVERLAYQLELEAIQQAYDDELISRATARRMRENVALMQLDLDGQV